MSAAEHECEAMECPTCAGTGRGSGEDGVCLRCNGHRVLARWLLERSVQVDVADCPRCGTRHSVLWFYPFIGKQNPHYSHFAECEHTGHMILLAVTGTPENPVCGAPS